MCIFEVPFSRVAPGAKFSITNPNYKHNHWPNCGPMLMECVRLETPTPDGWNAVDEHGRFHKIGDEEEVVQSYGAYR